MPNYHAMYLKLFSAQADAIDVLRTTTENLVRTHQEAEELLLGAPEPDARLFGQE